MSAPDIFRTSGGFGLAVAGQPTINSGSADAGARAATSPPGGPWTLAPLALSNDRGAVPANGAAAPDGNPFVAWGQGAFDIVAQRGLSKQPARIAVTRASLRDIGVDGQSGRAFLFFIPRDARELRAQELGPDGAPVGASLKAPASDDYDTIRSGPIVTGRPGRAGVYAAYVPTGPLHDRVVLWRVGDATARLVVRITSSAGQGNISTSAVAVAADPLGRVWVIWVRGPNTAYARRSNAAVTRFGPIVALRVPGQVVTHVAGNAQGDRLDLIATSGTTGDFGIYHSQLVAPLTVTARPARIARSGGSVRVTVTDAGDAVRGARVSGAGGSATTNARGIATLSVRPGRRRLLSITARHPDHGAGVTSVRVR
jgi:hypothetical protein